MPPFLPLFAVEPPDASAFGPMWSTNQVLYTLAAIVVPIVSILAGVFYFLLHRLNDELGRTRTDRDQLKAQAEGLQKDDATKENPDLLALKWELGQAAKDAADLKAALAESADKKTTLELKSQSAIEQLSKTLQAAQGKLEEYAAQVSQHEGRIRKALKSEGRFWSIKALQTVPKFRPAAKRGRAIISVCNLKGGVGKTTLTAHLGAALARRGYRVLFIDLDLQGSLTSLLLPQAEINERFGSKSLLQHFLHQAAADHRTRIVDYAAPIWDGRAGIVGTTDRLAYAELALTLRWLLLSGERDTRFLLRKALHLKEVNKDYDVVLLDCPPLINISCVNAFAASDYLLVPVLPSQKAAERVPILLSHLREESFRRNVNSDLKVMGLIANRTFRPGSLTTDEQTLWGQLGGLCRTMCGEEVYTFPNPVPRNKSITECEDSGGMGIDSAPELCQVFDALADTFHEKLPDECRRPATALA